jgi:hypothetical protein
VFHGGVFRTSPLFIQGSRHSICLINDILNIGCKQYTIEQWLENFERIGRNEGYTDQEIAEYRAYIDFALTISNLSEQADEVHG